MIDDEEIVKEFLVESYENLDQLDQDFVALESDPSASDRISGIFRTIHTIKGTSGFLGLRRLEILTHIGENVLSQVRDGTLALTPTITSALLTMVDRIREILSSIESTGTEGDTETGDIISRLSAIAASEVVPAATPTVVTPTLSAEIEAANDIEVGRPAEMTEATRALQPDADSEQSDSVASAKLDTPKPPTPASKPEKRTTAATAKESASNPGPPLSDSNVRVDVRLLDKLMNLVGELVLARNQILQFDTKVEDPVFVGASQRLNLITTELQEHVMKTRMQPIGHVWNKLPRVVRDLAISCGKQVRITMEGKGTELDRTILEAIKDPLTHIVRNAVDHGIESPDVRAAAGKPKTGSLQLRAFHEGGHVNIEISDDGAGLDAGRIRLKAIERGVVTAERADGMSEREMTQLLFLPGFSTAQKVTNVSGRGVGMDVVKTNIEKIGGTVDIISKAGVGSTLRVKIPLTLAIVPALLVTANHQRFAIPQVSLLELVRLEGKRAVRGVEYIHGAPVYRLRGRLLPLVYLAESLQLEPHARDLKEDKVVNIVVLQTAGQHFGLVVEDVRDTEEIVVKPLGPELKGLTLFAGATIMGDGRVALILDVLGLAQHTNAIYQLSATTNSESKASDGPLVVDRAESKTALVLFSVEDEGTMALPLSMVQRLENFPAQQLEKSGNRLVVQYRDKILPLIDLTRGSAGTRAGEHFDVIVYGENGRSVGFIVKNIIDIVEEVIDTERSDTDGARVRAAIIQGKVTDMLDVRQVISNSEPTFFSEAVA